MDDITLYSSALAALATVFALVIRWPELRAILTHLVRGRRAGTTKSRHSLPR